MKFNKIALALIATSAATVAANAGVTVTPMVGYHYSDADETIEKQTKVLPTGKESGLYTGVALGVDLTNATQFQVEYGVSNTNGATTEDADKETAETFDIEQQLLSGNFLVGLNQVVASDLNLEPYLLVGAGQSKIEVENQEVYAGKAAGTLIDESKDTIGNLGLGAFYHVNEALSLRGEARAIHNFDNKWWEGLATAGLEFALGRAAPAVVAPVVAAPIIEEIVDVDSDKDGVMDSKDACPNTPINYVVDARGCPIKESVTDALKMELRVFFDNNKSDVKAQYKPEVAKVAAKMREYPNAVARIEGHASKSGSASYNQRLSEARAVAVKAMLANDFGVNPSRIATKGYGFDRPIADNNTDEGQAMNRRVYAVITGNKQGGTTYKTK